MITISFHALYGSGAAPKLFWTQHKQNKCKINEENIKTKLNKTFQIQEQFYLVSSFIFWSCSCIIRLYNLLYTYMVTIFVKKFHEIKWFFFILFMKHADAVASSSIKFNYYFFLLLFFSTMAKIHLSALEKKAQIMD